MKLKLPLIFFTLLFALFILEAAPITLRNLEQFYLEPDTDAAIEFNTELAPGDKVNYVITDYLRAEKTRAAADVAADRSIKLQVKLPAGYYELTFPGQNLSFGIYSMAPYQGKPDYFFGINAGFSWFPNGDVEAAKMRMFKRSGIAIVHEFLSWQKIEDDPKPDTWHQGQGLYYHLVRQRLAASGLKVLEEFHDAPTGSGSDMNQRSTKRFPSNMLYVNDSWSHILQLFGPYLGGLEVWNETDDKFGPVTGYVPMVKAIAYAKQATGSQVPIVGGIFSQVASNGFRESSGMNRMLEVVDAISYHTYADPSTIEGNVQWYRDFLTRYGRESLPLYITESGWPWTGESAKNIVMKAVEGKACGIAQMYPFFAQYYKEGAMDFSLVRENQTPYPVLACYGNMARLLSNFEYVGDLKVNSADVVRARVFSNGEEYIAVIFTRFTGTTFKTPAVPIVRGEGIDGRKIEVGPTTVATDGLLYWFLDGQKIKSNLSAYINTNTVAMKLYQRSKLPLSAAKISPVVLQSRLKDEELVCGKQRPSGYFVEPKAESQFSFGVAVTNLGGEELNMHLELALPEGVTASEPAKSNSLAVAGKSVQEVNWTLNLKPYLSNHQGFDLGVKAVDANGNVLDYISVPILSANLERKTYETPYFEVKGSALPTAAQWEKAPSVTMSRNNDAAQDDFGVNARFMWSEQGLYFRFVVNDIVHAQENDATGAWRQDSIQLAFDPNNSKRSDGTQYEYGISLYQNRPRWSYWIMGAKKKEAMANATVLKITRNESNRTTVYEGRMAWAEIDPFDITKTKELGFDFCVNNSNGDQMYENLEWTPGISTGGKDSSLFGLLKFKK